MFRSERTKSALLAIVLFIAGLVFTLGHAGMAQRGDEKNQGQPAKSQQRSGGNQGGRSSGNTARPSGGQQSRQSTATPSNNGATRQQSRQNAARPSNNGAARQQSRQNAARPSNNSAARQQSRQSATRTTHNAAVAKQSRANAARTTHNAAVAQQGRANAARTTHNAAVAQQGRANAARTTHNAAVAKQGRANAARTTHNAAVAQQGRVNAARTTHNAAVAQQGRANAARTTHNAAVAKQGRVNAARTTHNAAVGQQGRANAARPAGNAAVRQQGRPNLAGPSGSAGLGRQGRQNGPSYHVGIPNARFRPRGESLQGWGSSARVDPVYVNQWHQPRHQGRSYYYDGFGYRDGFDYGYWAFGRPRYRHYDSPFFFFGLLFIVGERCSIYRQPDYAYYPASDYYYGSDNNGGYYLSHSKYSGLHAALDDIQHAWMTDNSDPMGRHIDPGVKLAVYQDGRYSYSMSGADYRGMTADAMHHTSTITFATYKVAKRSDGAYIAFAKQQFYDADNNYKVAFVSYTMAPRHGKWVMVAVGSSSHRLS